MAILKKYISIVFLFFSIVLPHKGVSQFFLHNSEPANLSLSFHNQNIETQSGKSFFNVIHIKNNGSRTELFTLNLSVPQDWQVLGQEKQELALNPGDSIILPLRISTSAKAKGDIGYSVIASLTDSRGNTIKNEYCFIKIESQSDLRLSVPIGINYFDQKTNLSSFPLYINNNGNKEELINLVFNLEKGIGLGEAFLEQYSEDITILPYTDTTINFTVRLKPEFIEGKESYRLQFKAETPTKQFAQSVWFRTLDSHYLNYISATEKTLQASLTAQGLMSEGKSPNYVLYLQGKTLLKNNNSLYYLYRNTTSARAEDFYLYNRMYIGANIKQWTFEIGDCSIRHE